MRSHLESKLYRGASLDAGFSSPYNYLIHEQRRKLKSQKNLYDTDTLGFKFVTLHVSRYKCNESLLCRTRGLIQLDTDVYECITPLFLMLDTRPDTNVIQM